MVGCEEFIEESIISFVISVSKQSESGETGLKSNMHSTLHIQVYENDFT